MIRYRSENAFGDGVRDIIAVMVYETYVLGNIDILEYLAQHYLFGKLKEKALQLCSEHNENGYIDDFSEEDWEKLYSSALIQLFLKTKKTPKYCLWLADKDVVKDYYCKNMKEFDLCAFETSNIILSDLGHDGTLYAYEKWPLPESIAVCTH